ncbi:MAG TPA: class I SAM-dependent methyltransferase, partial [Flavobacteriia bacterium]|nr:class I SAM-dependent methyltransferase [Flavobacteriia bacterium]
SNYFPINSILEIGTSLGIGTYTLAIANPKAEITTLEGCTETLKIAKQYLSKNSTNTINYIQGDFDKTLEKNLTKKYDLIYFDGNHQKTPTINYFESCLKVAHNDSIFIFDDIYWSKEMTEAWEYIKSHQKVAITIDFFHLGIVFFRKEQVKENFIIRG